MTAGPLSEKTSRRLCRTSNIMRRSRRKSPLSRLALVSAPEAESGWVNRGEPRRSNCRLPDTVALRVESQKSMVMGMEFPYVKRSIFFFSVAHCRLVCCGL
jgi:hypothetical protein